MHFAEGHEQPKYFESIPHAIYRSIITITLAYGNVEPVTFAGKLIAIGTGFLGVCMAAIMIGIVASAFATQLSRKKTVYAQQLQKAMEDGILSDEEKASLDKLKAQFGLTDKQVREISATKIQGQISMSQSTVTSAAPVSIRFYLRIQRSVFETREGEVHNPVSKVV